VHLTQEEDDNGPTLLIVHVCALHDDVGEEAPHRQVELDEPRAQVNFGEKEIGGNDTRDKMWFMDSGANNHMTGERKAFSELDTGVVGTVKFGDGSRVEIRGHGTIVFKCQNGEHTLREKLNLVTACMYFLLIEDPPLYFLLLHGLVLMSPNPKPMYRVVKGTHTCSSQAMHLIQMEAPEKKPPHLTQLCP
jgi:hypothetical protein